MLKTVKVPPPLEPLFESAQEYVGRFFAARSEVPEEAKIEIFGQRYVLVRARAMSVEFFEIVQRLYADKGQDQALGVARSLVFDIAHAMGLADANEFAEQMNLVDPLARLSAGPVHFSHSGWAYVDIFEESHPSPDENFYLLYDHPYSFESDSWIDAKKRTEVPICVMNSGYSSGWCEASFGVPLVSSEILCRARGDEHCRFIMAHPSRIQEYIQAYIESQPKLAANPPRYEIPGFFSRKRQEDELRNREEQYRGIFEAGTNGLLILGEDGTVVQANPAALRLFRCEAAALFGRSITTVWPELEFVDQFRAQIEATGHYQAEGVTLTLNDQRYFVEVRGIRFRFQDRDHLLAIVTDITDKKQIQVALRRAHDELEGHVRDRTAALDRANHQLTLLNEKLTVARDTAVDANVAKSAFLASMSHEIRTPLNAIIGCSELLEEEFLEGNGRPTDLSDLTKIRTAARLLLDLIDDILNVSKIEAGKMELFIEDFPLDELVQEIVAAVTPTAARNGNTLDFQIEPNIGTVRLDRVKVKQILLNLMSNACTFTNDGLVHLRAVRERGPDREDLVLHIRDTGSGIDQEQLDRLFHPFRQADESPPRASGGSGLGLSISLHFAEMMAGRIDATSVPGQGSTFTVRLPAALPRGTPVALPRDDAAALPRDNPAALPRDDAAS
ncbi:MAG TPA: ATP-binding protein [Nannocystis sp.]|jgi:PAS domain S-box-containing protein